MRKLRKPWPNYFLGIAKAVSEGSKDTSTKVGSLIYRPDRSIASTGFNGLPRGIPDTDENLLDRSRKYPRMVHAEANALAHKRECVVGYGMVITAPPCSACALQIISHGITVVYAQQATEDLLERWRDDLILAQHLLLEADVDFHFV